MFRFHGFCSLACLVVFLLGLFPVSPRVSPSLFAPPSSSSPNSSVVDRLVWVFVDALRGDFPVCPLVGAQGTWHTCLAPSPTVTLPRVVALLSGAEPSLSLALANFGESTLSGHEDTLLHKWQFRRKVFFGDDTWLRLFPAHWWMRSEGVTSFAVHDTVEVDANVTRHLSKELHNRDWDLMVLHYLGVDHVGHSLGPQHPRMQEKLAEMRNVLETILATLGPRDLLVVSGDHGMTEQGNHGGNSPLETSSQHLFLRRSSLSASNVTRSQMECHQADVTATLAELTGVPAPANCLGEPLLDVITAMRGNAGLAAQRSRHRLQQWARAVGVNVS